MRQAETTPRIRRAKGQRRLVMVTAYDAPTARWGEDGGADVLLVGDSLAMVVLGHETTLALTLDEMIHHAREVGQGHLKISFGDGLGGRLDAIREPPRPGGPGGG